MLKYAGVSAAKAEATDVTNGVAVMADAVAVAVLTQDQRLAHQVTSGRKGAQRDAQKVARMAGAVSAASAARNRAVNSAANNDRSSAVRARSSVSHAHRVSHANPEKADALNARGVNAASAPNAAASAPHAMPQSKTLPWPTRPQWQRRQAALRRAVSKTEPTAAHVQRAVNAMADATTGAANARMRAMLHLQSSLPTPMQRRSQQQVRTVARKTTSSVSRAKRASAAAATVMAASAANVLKAVKAQCATQTALIALF